MSVPSQVHPGSHAPTTTTCARPFALLFTGNCRLHIPNCRLPFHKSAASSPSELDHQTCRGSSIGRACGSYQLISSTSRSRVRAPPSAIPIQTLSILFALSRKGLETPFLMFLIEAEKKFVPRFRNFCQARNCGPFFLPFLFFFPFLDSIPIQYGFHALLLF